MISDGAYERFETAEDGLRALMKLLYIYQKRYGLKTITDIISRWAPSFENKTRAYIEDVSQRTNISPDSDIDLSQKETLIKLAKAIVIHESGHPIDGWPENWYRDETYEAAAERALA